jgi:PAS domain S-box-containing protein
MNMGKSELEAFTKKQLIEEIEQLRAKLEHQQTIEKKQIEFRISRLAALNMMEDAIHARKREETLNEELRIEMEERKWVQEALRYERDFVSAVIDTAGAIVIVLDGEGRITRFNRACQEISGYSFEEIHGRIFWEFLVPPEDVSLVKTTWDKIKAGDFPNRHENTWLAKDGEQRFISWSNTALTSENGKIEYIISTGIDITERKKAEEAAARDRANLQTIFNVVNVGMLLVDADGIVRRVNDTVSRWAGKDFSECPECQPGYFLGCMYSLENNRGCGQSLPCITCSIRNTFQTVSSSGEYLHNVETEVACSIDGKNSTVWFEISADPLVLDGQKYVMMAVNDITSRKQAELALEASGREILNEKNRLEAVLETLPVGMAIIDEHGGTVRANSMFEKIWGSSHRDVKDISDYADFNAWWVDSGELVKPEEWASALALQKGETVIGQKVQIERLDGAYVYVLNSAAPILDSEGRIVGCAVAILDITELKQTEEKLRETRDYLNKLLNYASAPVVVWDTEMKITFFNHAFEKLTGYSANEVIGQQLSMLFPDEDKKNILEKIARTTEGISLETSEIPIRRKNGEIRIALWNSANVISPDTKNLVATVAQGQDITERLKMEDALKERERDYRKLAENTPDLIQRFDLALRFIYVNPSVSVLYGFPVKEIIGKTLMEVGVEPDKVKLLESHYKKVFATGEPEVIEFILKSSQCKQCYFDMQIMPEFSGEEITSVLAISRDISDINTIRERLEEKNKELEQFAYVVSHDLQEPLRMVTSFTKLLERRNKEKLDEDALEYMKYIVDGATRMNRLIEDILHFSRVGRTDTEGSLIDCNTIIDKVNTIMSYSIEKTGAEVTHDTLPVLFANETRLIQLFQNLISNAIKFRKKEETPRVHISAQRRGNEWLFSVKDNGMGIDPKYFGKIFVIFQRLHGWEEYPGTGIGLAISRKIVETYGGKIWVDSAEGEGATFYFTFPV